MENAFGRWKGLGRIQVIVKEILELKEKMSGLSDAGLREKTRSFQDRLNGGEALDGLLSEAFAVVREAAKRVLGMEPFPVQMA